MSWIITTKQQTVVHYFSAVKSAQVYCDHAIFAYMNLHYIICLIALVTLISKFKKAFHEEIVITHFRLFHIHRRL